MRGARARRFRRRGAAARTSGDQQHEHPDTSPAGRRAHHYLLRATDGVTEAAGRVSPACSAPRRHRCRVPREHSTFRRISPSIPDSGVDTPVVGVYADSRGRDVPSPASWVQCGAPHGDKVWRWVIFARCDQNAPLRRPAAMDHVRGISSAEHRRAATSTARRPNRPPRCSTS